MVRTLDADRNAELERRYSVSYGNDRGNRKNMQTGRSSGAAKNTRGTQTARRRKDTDAAGAVGTSRTTGGRTAASTARANSTGRTTAASTARTSSTGRTAGGRTAGSTARTAGSGRTTAASTARANNTGRTAGGSTVRTAGTGRTMAASTARTSSTGRTTATSTARANNTGRTAGGSTVRTAGTGRTTGGSAARTVGTGRTTAASTARTSSTGRTTTASTVRTTGTARTAATVRTTETTSAARHAGTAVTARTARPAGTARTAGTVRSGRNINRNEQKRRIARETARGRGVRVDEASRTTTVPERRVRSSAMSFQSVIVMLALIVAMTVILVFYITLQAEVTGSSQQIANLEEQLTELKAENDASYNEITDSISLEEVRKKAIYELGMKYADRNQVVIYSGTEKDSVHQVSSLNDH